MKRKIYSLLIIISLLLVGCSPSKVNKINNNYDLLKVNNNIYPKIKELYNNNNLNYEEIKSENGSIRLNYENNKDISKPYINNSNYSLNIYDNKPYSIKLETVEVQKKDSFSDMTFDIRNTLFDEVISIVLEKEIDYKRLNEEIIYTYLKNNSFVNLTNEYENITYSIVVSSDTISYTINIYPN